MSEPVVALLRQKQSFLITTHVRPDGDAIGSQLALGLFLERLGKQVWMINSDPVPYNLSWMPGAERVQTFDGSIRQREAIASAEVVLVVDTNAKERIGRLATPVEANAGPKVLIDHHTRPENWFTHTYARESASSAGELVYELIEAIDPSQIDATLATALYTAIMTDTGSFRYSSVTPAVHRIVADLLERGDIEPAPIHVALFDTRSLQGLRLLTLALSTIRISHDGKVGHMVVSQRMVREASSSLEETEGFVNYALSVDGVVAAVLFSETDSGVKISFRSKGNHPVNEWARVFGGGGHVNASGAYIRRPLDTVVAEVMSLADRYLRLEPPAAELDGDAGLSEDDAAYLASLLDIKSQKQGS